MVKHIGLKFPEDLRTALLNEKPIVVLATFSETGVPHTMPVHIVYPKGDESILMSLHKDSVGYQNMAWQKKVSINVLNGNDVAYTLIGRAGVVRAPSSVHPLMHVVRIDVIEILSDKSALVSIDSGVTWSYTSPEAEEVCTALMGELKELARTL